MRDQQRVTVSQIQKKGTTLIVTRYGDLNCKPNICQTDKNNK